MLELVVMRLRVDVMEAVNVKNAVKMLRTLWKMLRTLRPKC